MYTHGGACCRWRTEANNVQYIVCCRCQQRRCVGRPPVSKLRQVRVESVPVSECAPSSRAGQAGICDRVRPRKTGSVCAGALPSRQRRARLSSAPLSPGPAPDHTALCHPPTRGRRARTTTTHLWVRFPSLVIRDFQKISLFSSVFKVFYVCSERTTWFRYLVLSPLGGPCYVPVGVS